ncbi:hypothetical protein CHS0354_006189 [Potamilus streckersoni]|uniref:Alkaline phosphatase, tissue-nonspecific isozyme n=1 Tax=Potamilus streckersoni TaxID=2493646 RepID=A0AAE0TFA9_9BIVA|nr:hypothetical protein CHS0354_006189 [Potamilus streckersoni]
MRINRPDLDNMNTVVLFVLFTSLHRVLSGPNIPPNEKSQRFWNQKALADLKKQLSVKNNNNVAKNVIMFLGDGMGPTTVTAARILRGQLNGQPGEETVLAFEDFPNVGLSKTYNVDRQTSDSAGTATAYLCGVKANYYTVGLDATVTMGDCTTQAGKEVTSILDWSKSAEKSVGIVSTARITHASPAGCYAHAADREWEGDVNLQGIAGNCKDIAYQLIHDNNDIDVLLGGGRRYFMLNNQTDPEYSKIDSNQRKDGHDLIKEWKDDKMRRNKKHGYVWNKEQFDAVNPKNVDYLLGLFEPNHMQYELERNTSPQGEPSLAEMTGKAIQILQKNNKGFFLFVEGARIDHAHHDSLAKKALHEVLAMEDAVKVAMEMTDQQDTLIIVTADHSHAFDITGYPYRGNDIFGLVTPIAWDEQPLDNLSYSTLIYGNGPNGNRANLTGIDMNHKDFVFPAAVPLPWETHGGEDVAIYARGPMSHLFRSTHEQNYIPHVMAFASCVGEYKNQCDRPVSSRAENVLSLSVIIFSVLIAWLNKM